MTKRRAYFLGLALVIIIFGLVGLAYKSVDLKHILPAEVTAPGFYKVTTVYDGDTIQVNMNGTLEKVRFIGVDTPETHKPNTPVQCFGPQASDYTKRLLTGAVVRLKADPTNDNRDRYGRLLRYVYTDKDVLVDQSLIQQGFGFAYLSFPFEKSAEFAASQEQAQSAKLGLWAQCNPTFNGGRWTSNSL